MTPQEFKQKRKALKISQDRLAQIMGVHPVSISRYEKEGGPSNRAPHPAACKILEYIERGLLDIDGLVPSKR